MHSISTSPSRLIVLLTLILLSLTNVVACGESFKNKRNSGGKQEYAMTAPATEDVATEEPTCTCDDEAGDAAYDAALSQALGVDAEGGVNRPADGGTDASRPLAQISQVLGGETLKIRIYVYLSNAQLQALAAQLRALVLAQLDAKCGKLADRLAELQAELEAKALSLTGSMQTVDPELLRRWQEYARQVGKVLEIEIVLVFDQAYLSSLIADIISEIAARYPWTDRGARICATRPIRGGIRETIRERIVYLPIVQDLLCDAVSDGVSDGICQINTVGTRPGRIISGGIQNPPPGGTIPVDGCLIVQICLGDQPPLLQEQIPMKLSPEKIDDIISRLR